MGGFEVVDPRYEDLYERAVALLEARPGIRSVEVGGSISAGTADRFSDLDLQVVTEPDAFDEVLVTWPEWLPEVTPTVFARSVIAPFIVNAVTADGLTLDLAVYAEQAPAPFVMRGYQVGMVNRRTYDSLAEALEYAVAEQMRGLAGPFIRLLRREEHIVHLTGVPHIVGLLTTVFLAENGEGPPAKQRNESLTHEQRAAVAGLPPLHATYDGVMGFGLGLAELLVTRARPLYPRYDLEWPSEFSGVVARRLQDQLGVDTSAWLY